MISNKEVDRKERIFIYYEVSFSCKSSYFPRFFEVFFPNAISRSDKRNDEIKSELNLMKGIEKIWKINQWISANCLKNFQTFTRKNSIPLVQFTFSREITRE